MAIAVNVMELECPQPDLGLVFVESTLPDGLKRLIRRCRRWDRTGAQAMNSTHERVPAWRGTGAAANDPPTAPWLRIGFWACVVIAIAAVVRRVVALLGPSQSGPPQLTTLDRLFASHEALTLAHIIPAAAFVALSPVALLYRKRETSWAERWLFPLGLVTSLTAFAMSAYSVGGWTERSAVLFFNCLFLYSLMRAWRFSVLHEAGRQRRWLLRAVVVLLGIATTRPVMGIFFATSRLTHLNPPQFFGIAFWIGFSINWIVVEAWLHSRDIQARA